MKRRDFLQHTGAAALAVGILPSCGGDEGANCAKAPVVSAEAEGTLVRIPVSELDGAGGTVRIQATAGGSKHTIVVARLESGGPTAVSWVCPHAGCIVCWEDGPQEFACPCHGSRFSASGDLEKGPAKSGLKEYAVTIEGETLTVDVA